MSKILRWSVFVSVVLLLLTNVAVAAGDAAAGKEKASTCTSCHGVDGQGTDDKTKISGLSVGKFKEAMQAYKSGERKNAMMEMFAKKLSDQDVEDLAAYYASK